MKSAFLFMFLAITITGWSQSLLQATPFVLKNQLIFIQLRVNDSKPLNFLFDTGAGITVVDKKTAADLELNLSDKARLKTSGKTIQSETSRNNTLHLGDVSLKDISLEIISLKHLSKVLFHQVDGIIGFDLLRHFVVETDVDKKALNLYDPAAYTYGGTGETLEMLDLEYGHFGALINLDLNSRKKKVPLSLKFDTGYPGYLVLNNSVVKRYELVKAKKRYHEVEGFSADTTITINYRSKVQKFTLAGKIMRKVPTVLNVDEVSIAATANSISEGLIGQQLLLDFNLIYDYHRRAIHVEER